MKKKEIAIPDLSGSKPANRSGFLRGEGEALFSALIVILLFLFLLSYFDPSYIFLDTTPTGGDTPAHNYLAKHLRDSFFARGEIIGWARGWWCGFPMFQYYFFLPYGIMAALSLLFPMNVAFKVVSVSGILLLPLATYTGLRWMKLERPTSLIGAIATIPFLFVDTHTMWGVNIYSTLAGEIANSVSFVFFVLFIGSFYRDMAEARFRFRSVFLLMLMVYSHFFTSVMAGAVSFFLLFLPGKTGFRNRIRIYLKTHTLTFLLVAWWIVPLIAKRDYSMEFGGDWDVSLLQTFPSYSLALLPPALLALVLALVRRKTNFLVLAALLGLSIFAYHTGGKINPSFTNIRFWPFIFFALMMLASCGTGWLLQYFRAKEVFVAALLVGVLTMVGASQNNVRGWVKWNYEGLENKPDYPAFRDLVLPLDRTPGRLANDLHAQNNLMGSTRVFETVPYLIEKDILEGGILNSATGSMFSYYIQGEASRSSAGFPTVVNPAPFNIHHATRHLKLANVKHFIARGEKTRTALSNHPEWKLLKTSGAYQLFELAGNDGRMVYIPENLPVTVQTSRWKETAMEWLYTIQALEIPFILHHEGPPAAGSETSGVLSEDQSLAFLAALSQETPEIPVWLTIGPFHFKAGMADEEAAELEPIDPGTIRPRAGEVQFGRQWKPILRKGPIFLHSLYQPPHHLISYNYVNIRADADRRALLHYSNDDHARIYLNGQPIVKTGITGLNNYKTVQIDLKKGDNPLVYKLHQNVGGAFFHARITGLNGKRLPGIRYLISPEAPEIKPRKIPTPTTFRILEEEMTDRRIRFKTNALHQPHIVKVSYFPNWKVEGASRIFHVTPNFMLVYPEQEQVTLYYGSLFSDRMGRMLTLSGILILVALGIRKLKRKA